MFHILTVLVEAVSGLNRRLKQLGALGVQPLCDKPEPISEDKGVRRTALSLT